MSEKNVKSETVLILSEGVDFFPPPLIETDGLVLGEATFEISACLENNTRYVFENIFESFMFYSFHVASTQNFSTRKKKLRPNKKLMSAAFFDAPLAQDSRAQKFFFLVNRNLFVSKHPYTLDRMRVSGFHSTLNWNTKTV